LTKYVAQGSIYLQQVGATDNVNYSPH